MHQNPEHRPDEGEVAVGATGFDHSGPLQWAHTAHDATTSASRRNCSAVQGAFAAANRIRMCNGVSVQSLDISVRR